MVRSGDGTGEGVAGTELLLFGDSGAPDGEGDDLFDGVASFSAMVFAIGERVVFRRHAVGELEGAADLLGRVNVAVGFAQQFGGRGEHFCNCDAGIGTDENSLVEGRAVEVIARDFRLLASELVKGDVRAGDGELRLDLLLLSALESGETLEDAFVRALGDGFGAI